MKGVLIMRNMRKVVVSNFVWLDKADFIDAAKNSGRSGEADIFRLKKNLTVFPPQSSFGELKDEDEAFVKIECFRETETKLGIPRHYYRMMSRLDTDVVLDVSDGRSITPNVKPIALREDQEPIVNVMYSSLTCAEWGQGLIEAYTGFGKSIVLIELILKLGGNALILINTESLMEQWIKNIQSCYPNARIGIIQGSKAIYKDCDIVIGMIQTLMSDGVHKKHPPELFTYFRTLVADEVHILGAKEFCKSITRFNFRYGIGASGTVRRADGCECVFRWLLGDIVIKAEEKNRINPTIHVRDTPFVPVRREISKYDPVNKRMWTDVYDQNDFPKPNLLNFIARDLNRSRFIAYSVVNSLKSGRNPIVMSERKEMLNDIKKCVEEIASADSFFKKPVSHGFFVGQSGEKKKVRKQALKAAQRCDVIYATIQYAKLGIDIVKLDTLFLASPIADPEQIGGRICRPNIVRDKNDKLVVKEKKKQPLIIDYVDRRLTMFENLYYSRRKHYNRLKWEVIEGGKQ